MRDSDRKETKRRRFADSFSQYRNDSQEIDLEYLSRQATAQNNSAPINLVIQTPESAATHSAAGTSDFAVHALDFLPGQDYHEYRFDWTPSGISFYVDGKYLQTFDNYDPAAPGNLIMNHWSNGNEGWSGGPPAQDAVLTVSYVKAYFNSTNSTQTDRWNGACSNGRWQGQTCEIPAFPSQGISPIGSDGNSTGHTDFFLYDGNKADSTGQITYPAATATSTKSAASLGAAPPALAWSVVGVVVAVLSAGLTGGMLLFV